MRAAKVQASLRIRAVSSEPPLLAHIDLHCICTLEIIIYLHKFINSRYTKIRLKFRCIPELHSKLVSRYLYVPPHVSPNLELLAKSSHEVLPSQAFLTIPRILSSCRGQSVLVLGSVA